MKISNTLPHTLTRFDTVAYNQFTLVSPKGGNVRARLYIRLWLLVIGATLLLVPTNAQLDIRWIRAFADKVLYIDLSPDGNWMALGKRNTTLVYRLPDRQLVQVLQGAPAVFVGSRLLAVGTEQGIELRDVPSFRVVWRMDGGRPV